MFQILAGISFFGLLVISRVDSMNKFGKGEIGPYLKFVAGADGKSFFADNTLRSWQDAGTFCKSLGMDLASITSRAQWNALDAAYDKTEFYAPGCFWTSGQDRLAASQFIWAKPNSTLDESYLKFRRWVGAPLQCIAYCSKNGDSDLINHMCTTQTAVLCETNPQH